jgi:Uma2 family endonuclease
MSTIVFEDKVRIPAGLTDLESFRRWARSDGRPEQGRYAFLNGELWVDLSMEQLFTHNRVKSQFTIVVGGLTESAQRGYFFTDGVLLSNVEADLSTIPDGVYVSYATLESGRVRLIEGATQGYVEIEGSPDMVLEIVSPTTERKDTVILHELYARAKVAEYWLVDARGGGLTFNIFRLGPRGFTATRRQAGGWLKSNVFGRAFQLTQETDPLGNPRFVLAVRP